MEKKLNDKMIQSTFARCMDKAGKAGHAYPWEDRKLYAQWLAQTYYYVRHSTRLLALASSHMPLQFEPQHLRFADHLQEERGHDLMAKKDLENLGFSIADFPELSETAAFYQTQYFWIQHQGVFSFFGWILSLEGSAVGVGKDVYARVQKAHGDKCSIFLRVHTREDEEHLPKAFEQLQALPEAQQALVCRNMILSTDIYCKILAAGQASVSGTSLSRSA